MPSRPTSNRRCSISGRCRKVRTRNGWLRNAMAATSHDVLPESVRALARADFDEVARRFGAAGFTVGLPAKGVLTVTAADRPAARPCVLLSVGVHGDETGPIEMVAHAIEALSREPAALAVDLMLCVGNIDAIAA